MKRPPGSSSSAALREEMEGSRGMSVVTTGKDEAINLIQRLKEKQMHQHCAVSVVWLRLTGDLGIRRQS